VSNTSSNDKRNRERQNPDIHLRRYSIRERVYHNLDPSIQTVYKALPELFAGGNGSHQLS
jgi:hypothetical protein